MVLPLLCPSPPAASLNESRCNSGLRAGGPAASAASAPPSCLAFWPLPSPWNAASPLRGLTLLSFLGCPSPGHPPPLSLHSQTLLKLRFLPPPSPLAVFHFLLYDLLTYFVSLPLKYKLHEGRKVSYWCINPCLEQYLTHSRHSSNVVG